jgi:hypothetical protein
MGDVQRMGLITFALEHFVSRNSRSSMNTNVVKEGEETTNRRIFTPRRNGRADKFDYGQPRDRSRGVCRPVPTDLKDGRQY